MGDVMTSQAGQRDVSCLAQALSFLPLITLRNTSPMSKDNLMRAVSMTPTIIVRFECIRIVEVKTTKKPMPMPAEPMLQARFCCNTISFNASHGRYLLNV
eukprot:scaffold326693_cov21-Prasinocladus_malaysianus.AAC.1